MNTGTTDTCTVNDPLLSEVATDPYLTGIDVVLWPDQLRLSFTAVAAQAITGTTSVDLRFGLSSTDYAPVAVSSSSKVQAFLHNSGVCLFLIPGQGDIISCSADKPLCTISDPSASSWAAGASRTSSLTVIVGLRDASASACASSALAYSQRVNPSAGEFVPELSISAIQDNDDLPDIPAEAPLSLPVTYLPDDRSFQIAGLQRITRDQNLVVNLTITNSDSEAAVLRLFVAASTSDITGASAFFRDPDTRAPLAWRVQISKNWHNQQPAEKYGGTWLSLYSYLRIPAGASVSAQLVRVSAYWGVNPRTALPLAAVSHNQLCLAGWGNAVGSWDESALGSFGESVTYDPDIGLGRSMIDDVRPFRVTSMSGTQGDWTNNVGGGDFLVYFVGGLRQHVTLIKTAYLSRGPNLTRVKYRGVTRDNAIQVTCTVQLTRTDDYVRVFTRLQYTVLRDVPYFDRLALYQLGADRYNENAPASLLCGDVPVPWNGQSAPTDVMTPLQPFADMPMQIPADGTTGYWRTGLLASSTQAWCALYGEPRPTENPGAHANRGLVVRRYRASLAGVTHTAPTFQTYFTATGRLNVELALPANVSALSAGDTFDADLVTVVVPHEAQDYFGDNALLQKTLSFAGNSFALVQREALTNQLSPEVLIGDLSSASPLEVRVDAAGRAELLLQGGLAFVPVSFSGIKEWPASPALQLCSFRLSEIETTAPETRECVWSLVDQTRFGGLDFLQTEFDAATGEYTVTLNFDAEAEWADDRGDELPDVMVGVF